MTARTKEHTRQLMLETGREILYERGVPEEVSIRLSEVLGRLQLTTGAAYHIWANQDAYRRDLTAFCAQTAEWPRADDFAQVVDQSAGLSFDAAVTSLGEALFRRFTQESCYTGLYFWSIKDPSPELDDAVRSAYGIQAEFADLLGRFFDTQGRQVIADVSLADIAATTLAMVEGFALRSRFESQGDASDTCALFGKSFLAYLGAVTT